MIRALGVLAAGVCAALVGGCTLGAPPEMVPPDASRSKQGKQAPQPKPKTESQATKENQAKAADLAKQGTAVMTDPKLKPSEKYPKALDLYRQALEIDSANAEAAENKALIEGIYRSMNKPIPAPL